ncbi:Scr1 family TA system antitoxin-like transcriptional regulator [Streptomyces sp. NPDC088146]|uniref:Scr1 family TA system antitoxin-like transcriptional regulator n=1 Tax=Streptomyces sp. NPDC088146 TaxID=3365829 RepID=UPI00380536E5
MPVGGPAVARSQLRHLVEQSEREHITVQVIPFAIGAHPGSGGDHPVRIRLGVPPRHDFTGSVIRPCPGGCRGGVGARVRVWGLAAGQQVGPPLVFPPRRCMPRRWRRDGRLVAGFGGEAAVLSFR